MKSMERVLLEKKILELQRQCNQLKNDQSRTLDDFYFFATKKGDRQIDNLIFQLQRLSISYKQLIFTMSLQSFEDLDLKHSFIIYIHIYFYKYFLS